MRRPDPYPLHRHFVAAAIARPSLWRVAIVVLGFEAVFEATPYIFSPNYDAAFGERPSVTSLDTLLEFAAFIVPCLALLALVWLIHKRGFWSLVGPRVDAGRDLRRVVIAVGIVLLLQEPLRLWGEWDYIERMRPLDQWLILLPFALAALLVQVGTEEIYFRGYLQQQLGVLSESRWVWMVIPSALFGLAHYINGSTPAEGTVWAIWAMALGMACADLTARTGNIGAAVGLHLANNTFAILVIAVEDWPASGLALWLYPYQDPWDFDGPLAISVAMDLTIGLAGVLVMWLAARVAIRR